MSAANLTEQNFETEVLKNESPVLVDFWAEWCGPCKMVSPIVDEIANDFSGKLKVGKVDIDQAQGLASKYGVMSIPTLMVFKGGQVVDQVVGAVSKEQLVERLKQHI